MTDAALVPPWNRKRQSEFIRQLPGSNLHHAIRLARSKNLPLNLFVTLNFSMTDCPEQAGGKAFQEIRNTFGKWVTRPPKGRPKASPAFVWVIENNKGLHAHWLVHVPRLRQKEFEEKLSSWLTRATGAINDPRAIDIRPAPEPTGLGRYMLKGQYPSIARYFGIEPEYQGWVVGRRIGHSKSLGPAEAHRMRNANFHPRAERWQVGKYRNKRPGATTQGPHLADIVSA